MEDKQDNITGVGATGNPTQNIGGQTGSPIFATPQVTQSKPLFSRSPSWMRGGVKLWVSVGIAFLLLTLGAVAYGVAGRVETDNASKNSLLDQTDKYHSQKIDLGNISALDSINLSTSQSLSVNGQLRANNSLVLAPTARPAQGTAGQLYYDQALNGLAYYNGSGFVSIAGDEDIMGLRTQMLAIQASIPTVPAIPTVPSDIATFSGQNIFQALNIFNGGVNASNLEVTENATLQGGLSVSGNTALSATTMSSLLLTTSLGVGSGGTGANSLTNNGVLLGQGTSPIASVTASGPNLCLMSTAGAPAFAACPGGGGSGVDLLNGLAGTLTIANASGAGATITINDATSAAKGIASFNATNFSVASGAVNTVQDISVTSSPTFSALSLTAPLSVASGGTGVNSLPNNGVIIGQGAGSLTGVTAGSVGLCLISTAGVPSFQTCPGSGGVVSLNGLTGTLTVNNSTGAGTAITIDDASTTSKGIASFNATNFLVSGGAVNVVQNINTSATPTFAGLTVNGPINGQTISSTANFTGSLAVVGALNANTITPTGAMTVGATGQSLLLQGNATTSLRATSAGITNSLVFTTPAGSNKNITLPNASGTVAVSASGPLALDANGNISCPTCATTGGPAVVDSLNGLTGALILANATGAGLTVTIDNASTVAKGIASFNSTNFTASSGAINTVQDINTTATPTFAGLTVNGSLNTNTITPTGAMTIGATGQSLTLQGNASTTLSATNGANTTSLAFQSPTANVTYRLQAAAAGTYDVCTTVGNCSGVGGGVTTPGGTVGAIAKFSAAQTLVDSLLSESGAVVTVNGSLSVNTISPTGAMTIGSISQDLILQGDDSTRLSATLGGITNSLLFSAPSGSNKTITLPNASGTVAVSASGPIGIDANGNISCPTCTTSGGGGGGAVDSLNGINGILTVANASGAGSVITIDDASTAAKGIASFNSTNFSVSSGAVNTIQDISVSSSPTFNALTLTTPLTVLNGGTGATTASGARTNLGAAASGANSDIISLSGLTTALSVGQGGTGATTSQAALNNISQLTANGDLLYHNGTNSTRLARGVNGECLTSNATTVLWSACGLTAEADTLASVTGRGATTATAVLLQGGATVRGMTIDTATATDDKIALSVTTGGAASFTGTLTVTDLTAARTWTLSDESGTICLQNSTSCGFALTSGSAAYIQNQNASQQATSNFWMSGTGRADTALQAPIFDTATATTLTLGGNATSISVLDNVSLAAGTSLTITGGVTGTRPGSPTEGMVYYDTTAKQLLTYANGKWQTDRSASTKIVAANNSTQAAKDAADYVADGTGDQVEINAALTTATGGKVYLMEGTYVAGATILIPNNTTLAGAGRGTLIELADIDVADNLIESSDQANGTGVVIQDLRLDGRKDLNTAGAQRGISLVSMGGGSGATARQGGRVSNVIINNMRSEGIFLSGSNGTKLTNNTILASGGYGIQLSGADYSTVTGNLVQGGTGDGFLIGGGSDNNTVSNNTVQGNASAGMTVSTSSMNSFAGNAITGGTHGFSVSVGSSNNTFTGNTLTGGNTNGFSISSSSNNNAIVGNTITSYTSTGIDLSGVGVTINGNTISGGFRGMVLTGDQMSITGNTISATSQYAIQLSALNNSIISNNRIHDSGGATTNNGIHLSSSDSNSFLGNHITDSSATTNNFAINISNSASDTNVLGDNALGTGSISDTGTNTRYQAQVNSSGNLLIQPAGTIELLKDTNVTGALGVSGNATVSGGTLTVGTAAVAGSVVINDGSSNTATIQVGNLGGNYVYTIPVTTASDSFCLQTLANCSGGGGASTVGALDGGTANADGATISGTTIYLQSASSSFAGFVNTTTQTFAGNKTFAGDLSVQNVSLAANTSVTITGGATGTRPGSPTEGMVYYDTTTKQLLSYANGKWQADRSSSTEIVGTSAVGGTSGAVASAAPDGADYINTSTTSAQTVINSAITALPATGGTVYLMEGTYIVDGAITVPSNVTITGAGVSTVLKLKNAINASINLVNANGGSNKVISFLKLDGNNANNSSGTQRAIDYGGAGNSTTVGVVMDKLDVQNFRSEAIYGVGGSHSKLTNSYIAANSEGIHSNGIDRIEISGNIFRAQTANSISSYGARARITNNNVVGGTGILSGAESVIANNVVQGSTGNGINVGGSDSSITSNIVSGNAGIGIAIGNSTQRITISGNRITDNGQHGIGFGLFTGSTTISNNSIHNSGTGTGSSSGISIDGYSGANSITDNRITDTAGTGFAIFLNGPQNPNNYLSGNTFSGIGASSISDAASGTIYSNQLDANGHLINRGTAAMSVNTATVTSSLTLQGGLTNTQLPVPAQPTVANVGTAGTTTYGYKVTALDGTGETLPSTERTTTTGNATLTGANYNTITWAQVPGAVQYKIYRTTSAGTPASTGLIGTVTGGTTVTFNDTGIAGTTAAPAANTTGGASIAGLIQGASATLSGALTVQTATATDDQLLVSITGGGAARFTGTVTSADLTANRVWTLPDETGTICLQGSANCGFLVGAASSFIQNQNAGQQATSNFWMSGTGRADTALQAPIFDTATATALTIGGTATSISVLDNVSLAAGTSLTVTGGITGTRPGSPTEGMVYYDTTTDQLLTYANGKWQADRSANTKIVAASNSTQANKDAADYVADGTGDEVEINAALTAATGGKVYLMEGTYTAGATILVPNDTVLSGAGRGTLIQLADIDATDNLIENASAQPRVTIRDLRIDGQKSLNTAGNQNGIYLNGGAGTVGPIVNNVETMNFRTNGLESRIAYANITDVTAESNTGRGVLLSTGTHQKLEGITSRSNGQQGIWIDTGADLATVTKSAFISNGDRGVRIDTTGTKFTNNTVTGSVSNGVETNAINITVTGNTVTGNPTGIVVNGNNNIISDNNISSNTSTGLAINSSADYTTVTGNNISSNGAFGIAVSTADRVTITSNVLKSNVGIGIQLDLTTTSLVANNYLHDNASTGGSSSIRIASGCCGTPDENRIIDNIITDTAGTGFAIQIANGNRNYLSGNTYSGTGAASISDAGTSTIYANQLDANGNLINRGTGATSVNTTTSSASLTLQGGLINSQLPTPALPVISRVGTAGTTTYGYKVTALDGTGETLPSTEGTIATANATLTGANYNVITWVQIPGAVQYKIYRTTSGGTPASTGLIGTVTGGTTATFNDTGIAATTAAPVANTTGGLTIASGIQGSTATLTGGMLTVGTTSQQGSLVVNDGSSNTATIQVGNLAGNYIYTIPVTTANDTFCMLTIANCSGGAVSAIGALDGGTPNANGASIVGSSLHLQSASGTNPGLVNTVAQTFAGDKTFTGILAVQDLTVGAGKSLTVTGGVTGTRPGSPTEGMVYYDTTTDQLLTYANGKWQADRSSSTVIVAANDSKNKDAADFVVSSADETAGNADAAITAAIAALPVGGGTVYLMEGTYTIDTGITLWSNTTLAGSGNGSTILKLKNAHNVSIDMVSMYNTAYKNNITIRDLQIDGNSANQTAGTQEGIHTRRVGRTSGSYNGMVGLIVEGVSVKNMRGNGIYLEQTAHSKITNSYFTGNTGAGINDSSSTAGTANVISNNTVNTNTGQGIIAGGDSGIVSGNAVSGNGANGIYVSAPGAKVLGNTVQTNTGYGVFVAVNNIEVNDNTISGNTSHGIFLDASGTQVDGNKITSNGATGVYMDISAVDSRITNNTINSNTGNGVEGERANNNTTITGNTIKSNTAWGVVMSGYIMQAISNQTVNNNYVSSNASGGIQMWSAQESNIVGNTVSDNGGATGNNGILIANISGNINISNNSINDTSCTTNCYAIDISGGVDIYLSNNTIGDAARGSTTYGTFGYGLGEIRDNGVRTIYANQRDAFGNLLNRGGAALTINTTTVNSSLTLQGGFSNIQLSTPAQPTVENVGTAGTTTYGYKVTAFDGTGETLPSTERTTTTGNATLSATDYNTITWVPVSGAVQYKIYRTTSAGTPASTGLIGTVTGGTTVSFNDTGIAATTAAPAANTTGGMSVAGVIQGSSANLTGGLTVAGATTLNGTLTGTGAALFKNTTNSATAFQIQDSSSNVLFNADTTTAKITVRTLEVTFNLTVNGHIISGGTTPTIAAGTAACTTPTVSMAGTDTAGTITVTTGTGCGVLTGKLATITFATAYGSAPRVVLTSATSLTAGLNTYIDDSTISTTAFDLGTNTTAVDSTTYKWYYQVIQ